MKRIKLLIQYNGTNYSGWQKQKNGNSIQSEIESAIRKGLGDETEVFASGRTDAGVHAKAQVAHFDTNTQIDGKKIYKILNRYLCEDIKILDSEEVDSSFHARFSVKRKTYEYKFYASEVVMPLLEFNHTKISSKFDFKKAKSVLKYFVGTHDFRSFCSTNTNTTSTVRTIYKISLSKSKDENIYFLRITGNGFLYNMVRIIAGTIVEVGLGSIKKEDIKTIFEKNDRTLAGKTMPAKGLTLLKVEY